MRPALLECRVGTILVDGFERFGGGLHFDVLAELRHPNALGLQVRRHLTLNGFGDVTDRCRPFSLPNRNGEFSVRLLLWIRECYKLST